MLSSPSTSANRSAALSSPSTSSNHSILHSSPSTSSSRSVVHNVFAGNPGSGKSTIANTVIGSPVFEAGVCMGAGLTTALNTQTYEGEKYSDTPGLDDIRMRELAAREISEGLTQADQLRLIFVCTLEDGRVRPSDVVTIETILDAVSKVGVNVDGGFSLIVNKCNVGELSALERDVDSRMYLVRAFACGYRLEHVYFAPKSVLAEGQPNVLLPFHNDLCAFIKSAPVIQMPGRPVTVDLTHYQERLNQLMREISNLKTLLNDIQQRDRTSGSDNVNWSQIVKSAAFAIAFSVLKRAYPFVMRYVM